MPLACKQPNADLIDRTYRARALVGMDRAKAFNAPKAHFLCRCEQAGVKRKIPLARQTVDDAAARVGAVYLILANVFGIRLALGGIKVVEQRARNIEIRLGQFDVLIFGFAFEKDGGDG